LCCSGLARADWTGVELEIADVDADWEFADGTHPAKVNSFSFKIEERANGGLAVGGGIGYQALRVAGNSVTESSSYDTQNLEVYLRQQIPLGQSVTLQGLLSYGYYSGHENVTENRAEITWSQVDAEFGAGFRIANLGFTPYVRYTDVDGDIRDDKTTALFALEDPYNYGLRFDIYVESSAFITIRLQGGSQGGGYLSFIRRY
jgi:hypothetical protein